MEDKIKHIKKNWKSYICSVIIFMYGICISVCTILMVMYFLRTAHDNEWLSFLGAIIGGLLTLGGVWYGFYLEKQKELQKTEPRLDLVLEHELFDHNFKEPTRLKGSKNEHGFSVILFMTVKNIGNSVAENVKIDHNLSFENILGKGWADEMSTLYPGSFKSIYNYLSLDKFQDQAFTVTIEWESSLRKKKYRALYSAIFVYDDLTNQCAFHKGGMKYEETSMKF